MWSIEVPLDCCCGPELGLEGSGSLAAKQTISQAEAGSWAEPDWAALS